MKEAPNKKMPPKVSGASTPTKVPSDEILSTLLRINNFDSISGLKDESLDIDLSACVTINSDLASMMNGNSLSSTDFWRMLDESAQNTQFDITAVNDIRGSPEKVGTATTPPSPLPTHNGSDNSNADTKPGHSNFFSGIFLKPEPPVTPSSSPISKLSKALPAEQLQHKLKMSPTLTINKIAKFGGNSTIKQEPMEHTKAECNRPYQNAGNGINSSGSGFDKKSTSPQQNLMKFFLGNLNNGSGTIVAEVKGMKEKYTCNECERNFDTEVELKNHVKSHRQTESRKDMWKKCPDCGKCLKLGSMWMHRKIHSDNKKYGCDICGQKFVQKINLTHHSRIHTAEKPYECPECQKRFQERSHLQRHQKYHAQTRSYRCDKCGKMYKTERCLKVHNLVHLEQRPFACNVCDKSFISNSKLKQHSNIHTGERPFKCNYCPRDFTNFPNWLKHTRRRHKVDHKTGEHLENIPSYCSKKSTKTTKPRKTTNQTAADKPVPIAGSPKPTAIKVNDTAAPKAPVKRRKKAPPITVQPPFTVKIEQPQTSSSVVEAKTHLPAPISTMVPVVPVNKPTKPKRERKQPTPKQVQKPPLPTAIKQEVIEPETNKASGNNFADLHCLSITSAEELIMEQALEMEECGLYDPPVPVVDTDNAISSETAAALQFKIKNEFNIEMPLKHGNNHLCSSLESSPFSSPASIELTQKTIAVPSSVIQTELSNATSAFYMPSFSIDSQGTIVTTMANSPITSVLTSEGSPTLIQQFLPTTDQVHTQHSMLPSTQALINHLYLQPLLMAPSNQALPPVDTLLFSAHSTNANFIHGKGVSLEAAVHHNLT